MPTNSTPTYNLKAVITETGVSADTLRAWERRYGLPLPDRSAGGHRLYSQRDIEIIKWLTTRQREGLSISHAVDLWNDLTTGGNDPLAESHQTGLPAIQNGLLDTTRTQWLSACLSFNEAAAEQVLNQAFALHPVETVCLDVLQKGISEIGGLWYQGRASVQHEHFASALAIRRLDALITAAPAPTRAQTILIGCPPDEWHTFSLLVLSLFLRRRGLNVVYLGANVPLFRFDETIRRIKPDLVILATQQLHTTDNLQEVALNLAQAGLHVGYGGRIFNQSPRLRELIPAMFLGQDIETAIKTIEETLLDGYQPPVIQPISEAYQHATREFKRRRVMVESRLLFDVTQANLPVDNMGTANQFLGENLSAALALGDVGLVESEIDWINGYLGNVRLDEGYLGRYLTLYASAVDKELGAHGELIVNWIHDIVKRMQK
jgi:DNA-binding transcriptional MerR regulator/methylmalonyl-CoA mutase cobalamin-binding subunit